MGIIPVVLRWRVFIKSNTYFCQAARKAADKTIKAGGYVERLKKQDQIDGGYGNNQRIFDYVGAIFRFDELGEHDGLFFGLKQAI